MVRRWADGNADNKKPPPKGRQLEDTHAMKVPTPKKLPSGMWRVQLQIDGERISVTRPTKKDCENEARLIKAEHLSGKKSAALLRDSSTLEAAMNDYIDKRSNVLSPSTVNGYRSIARTRFQRFAGERIDKLDWQTVINHEATLCSPKTLKNAWGFVRSVLAEHEISPTVTLPAPKPAEKNWLTPEQIPMFLEAFRGVPGEVGALLALSSLRRSEIYGLDWSDIDLAANIIHVHRSRILDEHNQLVSRDQNKTSASTRDVPIFLPRLRELLTTAEKKTGPVMTVAIGTLYDQIRSVCTRANLPQVGVHGLRHSFASLCYSLGVNELQCMKLGGWSDYGTMRKIYTHLSENDMKPGADKLTDFFSNAHENAHKIPEVQ